MTCTIRTLRGTTIIDEDTFTHTSTRHVNHGITMDHDRRTTYAEKAEEVTGGQIEKNRIIVISCKQVQTAKLKKAKPRRKPVAANSNRIQSQEEKLT